MSNALIDTHKYTKLLAAIQREFVEGERAVQQRLAVMYWRVGKMISKDVLGHKSRAGQGDTLFAQLAESLQKDASLLYRAVKFYDAFPSLAARPNLSWGHYKILVTIEDAKKRNSYHRQAIKNDWSTPELRKVIDDQKLKTTDFLVKISPEAKKQSVPIPRLSVKRGRLNIYRLLEVEDEGQTSLALDCGFHIYLGPILKGGKVPAAGDVVEAYKVLGNSGEYHFKKIDVPRHKFFTYKATVQKVVDGDSVPRKAAYEMRDGPSESTCRSRLQSALSGNGQNLLS